MSESRNSKKISLKKFLTSKNIDIISYLHFDKEKKWLLFEARNEFQSYDSHTFRTVKLSY